MAPSAHVLIVDDDREIRDLLGRFLTRHGYRTTAVVGGREMWKALGDWAIDLVVLDVMLPEDDGLALCRQLRSRSSIPVIMLTAMGEEVDRIVGLEMGADDYLAKPFNPRELLARIKAVLRRSTGLPTSASAEETAAAAGQVITFAGWTIRLDQRSLTSPDGVLVPLSTGEFDLLAAFVAHPQRVLSRDQLLDLARGREAQPFDRSIDVQVSRLRRKIEVDPAEPALIRTVRGGGYLFAPKVERA
jgi:Response regulators consisting of a CheY-like receiver domain and a winged-helix DNA-binding domain